mmetsp:Transcript_14849/g.25281  ORF Transcript_14849/g.25281 Transcript_14849/m.25281 type:complete len:372 (+) Transcript_14849:23-1138(+)
MKAIISTMLSTMFLLRPSSVRGLSTFASCSSSRYLLRTAPTQLSRTYDVYTTGTSAAITKTNGGVLMSMSSSPSSSSEIRKKKTPKKKMGVQRIDKVLADRGVGTRSQTFEIAKGKRITMASHPDAPHEERTRIKGPKEKVPPDAALFLDGNLLPSAAPLLLVYHKPKFVLSVMEDDKKYKDQERKHLGQVLSARYKRCGMHPVGRLDYDTTGLILFSLEGKLTQRLLHPKRGVEKEYVATVQGKADEEKLKQMLSDGVETTDGTFSAQLLEVTPSDGPASAPADDEMLWDEESSTEDRAQMDYSGEHSDVRLIVTEGKYRMVRRILANCGHPVVELRRERHGKVTLGDLAVGEFRDLKDEELEWAESLLK